jgi:hypothetical protein
MFEAFKSVNQTVFLDAYRQFIAYDQGGINAIQAMANEQAIRLGQLNAWQLIDAGIQARAAHNTALATQDFWAGNLQLLFVEQNEVLQPVYDNYKPLFLFLSSDPWFKLQMKSPVPGDASIFGDVVPNGVHGGQANVAEEDDRWQWVTAANAGIWDKYKAWQQTHQIILAKDVTNTGLDVNATGGVKAMFQAAGRLGQWQPN